MKHQSVFAETADRLKKPRPQLLRKREIAANMRAVEIRENKLAKQRSGGRCEVVTLDSGGGHRRCHLRASQVHHLIGGIGRRNKAEGSVHHKHKLHVCDRCHSEIHGHVLKVTSDETRYDAATVRYERVK